MRLAAMKKDRRHVLRPQAPGARFTPKARLRRDGHSALRPAVLAETWLVGARI